MVRSILVSALLIASACVASAADAASPEVVIGRSLDATPQSRVEGNRAIDDAAAAALIGAISSQFDERDVQVKLDHVSAVPSGIVQRDLSGSGRLSIGSDPNWIPFEFKALYDTERASVDSPALTLGSPGPGHATPLDHGIGHALANQLTQRLRQEFSGQPAQLALTHVVSTPRGDRFVQLDGQGTVDFGAEGTSPVDVQGLYDLRGHAWVRADYVLHGEPLGANAVASR